MAIAAALPVVLWFPFTGVLVWTWIAIMNPHREAFGVAHDFSFNFYIAIITLAAWLFSREPKRITPEPTTALLIVFLIWVSVTTVFAIDRTWSFSYWNTVAKTLMLVFAVLGLITTKTRIQALIWVIAVCLGYYAVKGAGFLLLTGGHFMVFGPMASMIADNNSLALALVLVIPLLNYLRKSSRLPIVEFAVGLVMILSIITVIGTYSRGGLLGLAAIGLGFWIKSRHKLRFLLVAAAFAVAAQVAMPSQWKERMLTINVYGQDVSFQGREQAWGVSLAVARDHALTGGGFGVTQKDDVFRAYNVGGSVKSGTAAHSIYFQVLGEHGFIGLALYLVILFSAWFNAHVVIRLARDHDDLQWASQLAHMLQISFFGFMVAGSLLSMAYYDAFLVLVAVSAILVNLVRRAVAVSGQEAVPGLRDKLSLAPAASSTE